MYKYRGIHEKKSSEKVFSAVCYTIYTIYLSICTQTAETISPKPFSGIPLYVNVVMLLSSILHVCLLVSGAGAFAAFFPFPGVLALLVVDSALHLSVVVRILDKNMYLRDQFSPGT